MNITTSKEQDTLICKVSGDVNINTAHLLLNGLKEAVGEGPARMVVDLGQVEYMDSSGIGVLVSGMKTAKSKQIPFALAAINERVRVVLEMTRLCTLFHIFPDVEAALKELV